MRRSLLLVLIAAAACSPGKTPTSAATVTDSAGIQIVESRRPAWTADEVPAVDSAPELVIGDRADSAYVLDRVAGAARLTDGRIVVADGGSLQLRFFDAAGSFLRAVGGRGGGPGEFQSLNRLVALEGDTLGVISDQSWNVSFFDSAGAFIRRVAAFDPSRGLRGGIRFVLDVLGDQTIVVGAPPRPEQKPDGARWVPAMALSALERTADAAVPFDSVPFMELVSGDGGPRPVSFGATAVLAAGDTSLFVGFGGAYSITEMSSGGQVYRVIRRRWDPVTVTKPDIDGYAARWMARWGKASGPEAAQERRDLQNDVYADHLPAFSQFEVDRSGRLWAREPHVQDAQGPPQFNTVPLVPSVWSVFGRDGSWLGDVTLPARFTPTDIGADYVLGIAYGPDGVQTVVEYGYGTPSGG